MASKSKKVVLPKPEPIITRNKSAQQKRQPKPKTKSPVPPPQIKKKPEPKKAVSKVVKKDDTTHNRLKKYVLEQLEYYPNKLKRNLNPKKIKLNPKHNFKVIASTNKRKMGTPQQASGLQSPQPKKSKQPKQSKSPKMAAKPCKSPEISMQEMIRLIEENRSLSDEDFMEILTCPSPVWWEDPPDGYVEDSICTQDSPINEPEKPETKINFPNPQEKNINNTKIVKNSEKFVKKQLKLENVLGNIKKKCIINNKSNTNSPLKCNENRNRNFSESTEECNLSDTSFNEEEILKNLENMDIPIENEGDNLNNSLKIKKEILDLDNEGVKIKTENEVDYTSIEKVKLEVTDNILPEDIVSSNEIIEKSCKNNTINNKSCIKSEIDKSNFLTNVDEKIDHELKITKITENNNKKTINDLSEYITVYKIIPENYKSDTKLENNLKNIENSNKTKSDTVKGKMNNFFKHSKNGRVVKTENDIKKDTIDSENFRDVTITKISGENRLKSCDSIEKNGCDKSENCEKSDTLNLINEKQISTCKNNVRISWNNSLMLNQT